MPGILHQRVLDDMGRSIVGGATPVGAVMQLEKLEAEHQVSRSVVREVIRVLQALGLVESVKRTGIRVRPMGEWKLLDPFVIHWRLLGDDNGAQLRSLTELRTAVEPRAAELAAMHAAPHHGRELLDLALQMREAGADQDVDRFLRLDIRFHSLLLHATGNELLACMDGIVSQVLVAHTTHRATPPGPDSIALARHVETADAIHARDAARAHDTMELLARTTMGEILEVVGQEGRIYLDRQPLVWPWRDSAGVEGASADQTTTDMPPSTKIV